MVALRRLIQLAAMAAAFHHSRSASARSLPDPDVAAGQQAASAPKAMPPPPMANNAAPLTTGAAVTRTESTGTSANVRSIRGNDDAATPAFKSTGRPSLLRLTEKIPPRTKTPRSPATAGDKRRSTPTSVDQHGLQPFVTLQSAWPPEAAAASASAAGAVVRAGAGEGAGAGAGAGASAGGGHGGGRGANADGMPLRDAGAARAGARFRREGSTTTPTCNGEPDNSKVDVNVVATLRGHTASVSSVCFNHDGSVLASAGGYDDTAKLWRIVTRMPDNSLIKTLEGHTGYVNEVCFNHDGSVLASGADDSTIKLWSMSDNTLLKTLEGHADWVWSVAFNHDGSVLASGSGVDDRTIKLWSMSDYAVIKTLQGHGGTVYSVAFNHDGSVLASGSYDATIKLWSMSDYAVIKTLGGHSRPVYSVAFNHDGSVLASGSSDDTIKLWSMSDYTVIKTLGGHSSYVWSVAFNHDGSVLASGSYDATIKLWSMSDYTVIKTLQGHAGTVYSVAFNHDGSVLASGSDDRTIKLWRETCTEGCSNRGSCSSIAIYGASYTCACDQPDLWSGTDCDASTTTTTTTDTTTTVSSTTDTSTSITGTTTTTVSTTTDTSTSITTTTVTAGTLKCVAFFGEHYVAQPMNLRCDTVALRLQEIATTCTGATVTFACNTNVNADNYVLQAAAGTCLAAAAELNTIVSRLTNGVVSGDDDAFGCSGSGLIKDLSESCGAVDYLNEAIERYQDKTFADCVATTTTSSTSTTTTTTTATASSTTVSSTTESSTTSTTTTWFDSQLGCFRFSGTLYVASEAGERCDFQATALNNLIDVCDGAGATPALSCHMVGQRMILSAGNLENCVSAVAVVNLALLQYANPAASADGLECTIDGFLKSAV
eukprot:gene10935-21218_t